jgi:hypothetical protein
VQVLLRIGNEQAVSCWNNNVCSSRVWFNSYEVKNLKMLSTTQALLSVLKLTANIYLVRISKFRKLHCYFLNFFVNNVKAHINSHTVKKCYRFSPSPAGMSLTKLSLCPASQVKRRPKCDRIAPSHSLSWPCVSDLLATTSKARAATRCRNPRWLDSTTQN